MPRKPTPDQFDALYARVSSVSQDTASQEPDLKRAEKASDLPCVWYRDKFSGKTMDRPGWNRLWADVLAGKVRSIIVWKLDRLGRTAIDLLKLVGELRARGVKLVLIREGFAVDDASPAGKMFLTMLAGFSEYEREIRAERQRAGIDAAKVNGTRTGNPFGRPKVKVEKGERAKRVKVTPEQEQQVRTLAAAGESKAAIARATGLSRPTVYSVLGGVAGGK